MDYKQKLISFELYIRHIVKAEIKDIEKPDYFNYRESTQFFPDDDE